MSLLVALLPAAWPCAGLVTPDYTAQLASSDAQQAILHVGATEIGAEYRVRYAGNASDFAWIIPVPGKVERVEEGSEARFAAIEATTAPTAVFWSDDEDATGGGGCGGGCLFSSYSLSDAKGGDNSLGGDRGDDAGISIVATGFAGDFVYTVLEAENADGLVAWLEAEGYDPTISAPSIQAYVDDDIAYSWVAVQLAPDVTETPEGGVALPPLRIAWSAGDDGVLHARYPARMAATSMLSEVRTELFVMAGSRVDPGNGWTAAPRDFEGDNGYTLSAETDVEPVDAYTDALRAVGTTHPVLFPVWGGTYEDSLAGSVYLTRYDTVVAPPTNQSDVTFTESGDLYGFYTTIGKYTEGGSKGSGAPSPAWLVPLGIGGLLLRRRR